MNTVKMILICSLFCFVSACSAVKSTGEAIDAAGDGVGQAVTGIGQGAGTLISGTGEAIERGADRTDRKGY